MAVPKVGDFQVKLVGIEIGRLGLCVKGELIELMLKADDTKCRRLEKKGGCYGKKAVMNIFIETSKPSKHRKRDDERWWNMLVLLVTLR